MEDHSIFCDNYVKGNYRKILFRRKHLRQPHPFSSCCWRSKTVLHWNKSTGMLLYRHHMFPFMSLQIFKCYSLLKDWLLWSLFTTVTNVHHSASSSENRSPVSTNHFIPVVLVYPKVMWSAIPEAWHCKWWSLSQRRAMVSISIQRTQEQKYVVATSSNCIILHLLNIWNMRCTAAQEGEPPQFGLPYSCTRPYSPVFASHTMFNIWCSF